MIKITKYSILFLCFLSKLSLASSDFIGDKIQNKFDENLFKMTPYKQSHYAIRLYRITGNDDYLYPIISYQFIESEQLDNLLEQKPFIIPKFKRIEPTPEYEELPKTMKRKLILEQFPGISNALNILLILDHAKQVNTLNTTLYSKAELAINHIKKNINPISAFLLDSAIIRDSSAPIANVIYLLKRLEIIDLREEYLQKFKEVFANQLDSSLSDERFEDKIYGMTHIIFAASDYYQKQLSYEEYKWIYDYFELNMERILTKTRTDAIAEVGLTFCLLKQKPETLALTKIKTHLRNLYDPNTQMLKGRAKETNLNQAEHRNVLAIMVFNCPSMLYKGPNLEKTGDLFKILKPVQPL